MYYKLTNADGQTYEGTQWGPGVRHDAVGLPRRLCTDGVIHAYEHPLIAVLMSTAHTDYLGRGTMRLWECELHGEVIRDGQLKCGAKGCTTIREIPVPKMTMEDRIAVAIRCTQLIYSEPVWDAWANSWLANDPGVREQSLPELTEPQQIAKEMLAAATWTDNEGDEWRTGSIVDRVNGAYDKKVDLIQIIEKVMEAAN